MVTLDDSAIAECFLLYVTRKNVPAIGAATPAMPELRSNRLGLNENFFLARTVYL
jgi:hypothetical protein